MEYFDVHCLGDLLRDFFQRHKGADYMDEMKAIDSWKTVVGPFIASHTVDLSIRNQILFVRVDSDVLRMELGYSKSVLLEALNNQVGRDLLTDIVLN